MGFWKESLPLPDVIRLSLLAGVVQSLAHLDSAARDTYIKQLSAIEKLCAPNATAIKLSGMIQANAGVRYPIDMSFPIEEMRHAARKVGSYIVTTPFKALGNRQIQDLETWDDFDESVAVEMSNLLGANKPASELGDDAHLLAGANLAVLGQPDSYAEVSRTLEMSLDNSVASDPYWSGIAAHRVHSNRLRKH